MTALGQPPSLAERVDKLEKENRHLVARLEKLEKRGGSIFFEVLRTALLLVVAALLLHLMGLLPGRLERLPLVAQGLDAESARVERLQAGEVVIQDSGGAARARLGLADGEPALTFLDAHGQPSRKISPGSKP